MLNKLNIRNKMFLILITAVIAVSMFVFLLFITLKSVEKFSSIEVNVEKLKSSMLMLRRHEKDFLLRKELRYKDKFLKEYQRSINLSVLLSEELKEYDYKDLKLKNYLYNISLYNTNFINLTKEIQEKGVDENSGLYGSLRKSIHKVQFYAKKLDFTPLLVKIYELRKNEKDFMLRKDLKYKKDFMHNYNKLLKNIQLDKKIATYLIDYKNDFLKLVDKEVVCGLNENLGLQGTMRLHIHKTEKLLKSLEVNILEFKNMKKDSILKSMYITAFISIILTFILILVVSDNIIKSLNIFKKGLLDFFDYLNQKKESILSIDLKQKDEFGEMAELINKQIVKTSEFLEFEKKELDKIANYDQLTGIYNRHKLYEFFTIQINRLKRYGEYFSIMLIDIDDFKKVNDTYGHIIGDEVLKEFVRITKSNIREVDIFARWGGEEFIIILPDTEVLDTFKAAQKIRKSIVAYNHTIIGSFTVSIGVAYVTVEDTLDTLTDKADIALYKAKTTGKNKTVVYKENL